MTTATSRMPALNTSCPLPSSASRQRAGERCEQHGAEHARGDATNDPACASWHRLRRGKHDADDQPGFKDFTKDDNEAREHG